MRSGRAVVLGAGVAGLLAAGVLADFYDDVTIVERDESPAGGLRRGVGQGGHAHSLLDAGRQLMEGFLPGLTDRLTAGGALRGEPLRDTAWFLHGARLAGRSTGLSTLLMSRPLLEGVLREAVLAGARVGLRTGVVESVREAGVALRGEDSLLTADLVVDACGRSSRLPQWLGADPVPEQRVDVDLGYATRTYRRDGDPEYLATIVSTVPRSRGGALLAVEGNRWLVTLAGMQGDHPPTDPDAFTAWAATLPVPDIATVIGAATPLDDPRPYRFAGSRWRRYDRTHLPGNVVALGDSVCSLNPLYAQGMTLAAQQVRVLRNLLAQNRFTAGRFQQEAVRPIRVAWDQATRSDLAALGRGRGLVDRYVTRVQRGAHHDPALARAFLRVANLVEPPATLLRPGLVLRALRPMSARAER